MTHNKGKKLHFCETCKRNRFCIKERFAQAKWAYTCFKGHVTIVKMGTLEEINLLTMGVMDPKITELFNRDNTFFNFIKRKG